ncbi:MAG: hypothetical protein CL883_04970, partial [Dehalococcoidia bacterium]|nr:hypothetical protein [Dehalococcoidia bacterium]
RDRNSERLLYSAVLTPLVSVTYDFSIRNNRGVDDNVKVTSQSNIYDMVFDSNTQELKFVAAGPPGSNSKTTVVLPGSLLSGGDHALACCIEVVVDGKKVSSSSTNAGITFEYVHVGSSQVIIKTK